MWRDSHQIPLRDRHSDQTHPADKPPILRRLTLRWLCVACLAVIAYGTLGPLGLQRGAWLVANPNWQYVPPCPRSDYNDVFTNLLVYIPVGIAFRLLVRRRGAAPGLDLFVALSLSVLLSYVTEVLQQFMPARSANLFDCLVNAVGVGLGCLLAPGVQRLLRRGHLTAYEQRHANPWTLLAWVAAIVTGLLMITPFYPSRPSMEVVLDRTLDLMDLRRFGMFMVLGFCLMAAALRRHAHVRQALLSALGMTCLLAVLFELAQIFITSHTCGLLDIIIAVIGGAVGIVLSAIIVKPEAPRNRPNRWRSGAAWCALLVVIACGVLVLVAYWRGADHHIQPGEVCWIPFYAQFMQPFHIVVAELVESLALFTLLTLLALAWTRGRKAAAGLLLVLGVAGMLETLRALAGRGPADITPLILAVVAWLLTVGIWRSLLPQRA
ncbi:MAG: VanZ family protein [Planctomycetota bacterium]